MQTYGAVFLLEVRNSNNESRSYTRSVLLKYIIVRDLMWPLFLSEIAFYPCVGFLGCDSSGQLQVRVSGIIASVVCLCVTHQLCTQRGF